ncbi:septum formation inhibitor [Caminibacter mediatlanticus TB-2]|uniref:Septum formation inhibitor n=1 Tax=Caminibacter mediatlanticus TB-2 TaxID=391592 RepID=A0ABX5VC93_9BACT|nr:septum formation inhibitor [Caminibacter mediatlanticus]QCT95262.1 septum formation inhibitor [Caminibacter mediatlanticus TB-2]
MKQKTLRVFEVEDYENLKNVIKTKYPLIKNHYFLLKEKNEKIENLLKRNHLNYFIINGEINSISKSNEIKVIHKEKVIEKPSKIKIYDKIIRSGEEIEGTGHFVFLERINAGAKINIEGNIEILEENEGLIICNGDYLLVKKNIKGTIIFNNEEVGKVEKLTVFIRDKKKVLE